MNAASILRTSLLELCYRFPGAHTLFPKVSVNVDHGRFAHVLDLFASEWSHFLSVGGELDAQFCLGAAGTGGTVAMLAASVREPHSDNDSGDSAQREGAARRLPPPCGGDRSPCQTHQVVKNPSEITTPIGCKLASPKSNISQKKYELELVLWVKDHKRAQT